MGASVSSSASHFSHGNNNNHTAPLERVDSNNHASQTNPTPCGVCHRAVEVGTVAYRCPLFSSQQCSFLLHEACYRRPKKLKRRHHHEHRLTLGAATNRSCSICGERFGAPPAFAYSCTTNGCAAAASGAGSFQAHPRCCDLPEDIIVPVHADHGKLVLRAAAAGGDGRRCLKCNKRRTAGQQAAPWSYQCLTPKCDMEFCLRCLLSADRSVREGCWCAPCRDVVVTPGDVHCVGQVMGVFLCGLVTGMGYPPGLRCSEDMDVTGHLSDNSDPQAIIGRKKKKYGNAPGPIH